MRSLLLAFVMLLTLTLKAAASGGVVGNGGDEVALDFVASARTAAKEMRDGRTTEHDVLEVLEAAMIVTVDHELEVPAGGNEQDSVSRNYPDRKLIEVNRLRWSALKEDRLKEAIALHEVLSLMGIESTGNYRVSGPYLINGRGPMSAGASELPAAQVAALQKLWKLNCTLTSNIIVDALRSRFQQALKNVIADLTKRGLSVRAESVVMGRSFSGFTNSIFKLGVLSEVKLSDTHGTFYNLKTRDYANDEFYRMQGLWLEFNPVDNGRGTACEFKPVVEYKVAKSDVKRLPLYEVVEEGKDSAVIASVFDLFSTRLIELRDANPQRQSSHNSSGNSGAARRRPSRSYNCSYCVQGGQRRVYENTDSLSCALKQKSNPCTFYIPTYPGYPRSH